ncbi:WD40 repeat-like protein [Irpex rosettiformis]|uniref:WD40 repeat-like protein n=1 Tax=Irpex rosettiformis TaxID=378272 RepID=A0ACB8UDJ4_9APHY|nr:WD40 repeat-like protein [Irpex rosettiformis]
MPDTFTTLDTTKYGPFPPSHIHSIAARWKTNLLSASLSQPLDRINVLGDGSNGHTGCVNALSWARDGEFLLSGGDDTTVRLWRIDSSNVGREYPFVCDAVIRTGHRGNIFNAQLLPHSARIATVARDGDVRISDIGDCMQQPVSGQETVYTARDTNLRILRCHKDSVKRIVTEDSPDLFLTVSEDGTVRQHDLRVNHSCRDHAECPEPLVEMDHELATIGLSPLTPYQFVVAGDSAHGYLFDRRQSKKHLKAAWGMSPDDDCTTTCVRRFGRASRPSGLGSRFPHITGARVAQTNGHEVLLSYSSDAIYLYSALDDPQDISMAKPQGTVLPSNPKNNKTRDQRSVNISGSSIPNALMEHDIERLMEEEQGNEAENLEEIRESLETDSRMPDPDEEDEDNQENDDDHDDSMYSHVPVVYPRARYAGACNIQTVKDVNFLGPQDEYIVSGSDDGYWFMWDKQSQRLHDILEGDSSVVNVIEGHPHLPLVAVSGIDTTVKLFAPAHGERRFSRIQNATSILQRNNEEASSHARLPEFMSLPLLALRLAEGNTGSSRCEHQ